MRLAVDLPDAPLSLAAFPGPQGTQMAAGLASGTVHTWSAKGEPLGQFRTGGPVHALCPCDLDGDGRSELLVGSDDEHLYALAPGLKQLWKVKVPFLRKEQIWMWWTLNTAKVRKIHCADINADGKPEILLGVGNMRLHCMDWQGKELWRFRTDHGISTTIVTADVFGEGKPRVLAGNGLTSSNGACRVFDENGKVMLKLYNGSWCTSLPAIAVADLDADGNNTIFCGNNRGNVRAYPATRNRSTQRWIHNMTRPVRSLTPVPAGGGRPGLLVVGSDSGYLCAFAENGDRRWGVPLSSAILATAELKSPGDEVRIAAACKDGNVFVVDCDGAVQARARVADRIVNMLAQDTDADGADEIITTTRGPARVVVLDAR